MGVAAGNWMMASEDDGSAHAWSAQFVRAILICASCSRPAVRRAGRQGRAAALTAGRGAAGAALI